LVTLLIPSKHYPGQTTSDHPSCSWYLSKPVSVPMKFTLVEPGVPKPLYEKQIDSPKVGMTQIALPKDRPELRTGRPYAWSVTLVCNSRRPSANPFFYSWIERVPTTPAVSQQLAQVNSESNSPVQTLREQALIYAQAGLWYNTLETISQALTTNSNNQSVQEDFLALLDQVGLTEVAKEEQQRLAQN
jgi:hypothetical protein